ncbi:DUF2188 domain-containing protein [Cupriavidus pinatubonensis]|uniref:DUF2188 domain-containing protein n=1 Tax=Cupriavidus pinatubonensis TaxID=248026 RepID=UPI0029621090|nr:DUF2188 domain-containing protein [Cupriavidus pinatubonensis]
MEPSIMRVSPAAIRWTVLAPGINDAQCQFSTMEDAIAAGWALARQEDAELHIIRQDGVVRLWAASDPPVKQY